ncbi:hypothetical protein QFZ80_001498 [Paenibacillus sp. V4I7]|nr:hypothetical protein [Paenibacillus sp. V4I7]
MRAIANPEAASSLSKLLDLDIVQPIAEQISAPDKQLRAELILSQLIGLAEVRNMLRSKVLSTTPLEQLFEMLNPVFQYYLTANKSTNEKDLE